jgi:hypothetical protein
VPTSSVELARHEWQESYQRLEEEATDVRRRERLHDQVDALVAELRRRVGQWFTLEDLAAVYEGADAWSREIVADRVAPRDWLRTLPIVEGAAFHLYSRGAVDYSP